MTSPHTIGLLGFGRIGRAIYERVRAKREFELEYALVRSTKSDLPRAKQITDPDRLSDLPVDLCVEVATPALVAQVGPAVLEANDLMVLSGSALADPAVEERLRATASASGKDLYLPHAALLGIDGLVDARDALTDVSIETTKHPDDIDFGFTDEFCPDDITDQTTVYNGSVRKLCGLLPRSFNSHAVVALASLGLDETGSTLVADPAAERSTHVISASGEQFHLEIERQSAIGDAAGNYTHVTIWGSIRRTLSDDGALKFV